MWAPSVGTKRGHQAWAPSVGANVTHKVQLDAAQTHTNPHTHAHACKHVRGSKEERRRGALGQETRGRELRAVRDRPYILVMLRFGLMQFRLGDVHVLAWKHTAAMERESQVLAQ